MATDILTAKEAAEYLKLSVETVKAKAREGLMPTAKIGREWRFSRRQLLEWIEEGGPIPESLVDEGLVTVAEHRTADADRSRIVPWDEAEAALKE